MPVVALALAFLAGLLTILSPCVLPLTPILAGSALVQHRFGPAALALGLAGSFSLLGLFIATLGLSLGLDNDILRRGGAALMLIIGIILLTPRLEIAVSTLSAPISNWANERSAGFAAKGLLGQFALGGLLGLVWSPCVGPTLGAASALAAQGKSLASVTSVMAMFGLGAAIALVLIGYTARALLQRHRGGLHVVSRHGKKFLGGALAIFGVLILSGLDRFLEGILVTLSPEWLTKLTTLF